MPLWFHEILHFSLFALVYVGVRFFYKPFKDSCRFAVGFIGAFLIDLDHLVDYFIFNNFSKFDLFEFLSCKFYDISGKAYLIFHAWEYIVLALLVGYLTRRTKWASLLYALALGMFVHLTIDTLINGLPKDFYFLAARVATDFSLKRL